MKATAGRAKVFISSIPWAGFGVYWFVTEERVAAEEWRTAAETPVEITPGSGFKVPDRDQVAP